MKSNSSFSEMGEISFVQWQLEEGLGKKTELPKENKTIMLTKQKTHTQR